MAEGGDAKKGLSQHVAHTAGPLGRLLLCMVASLQMSDGGPNGWWSDGVQSDLLRWKWRGSCSTKSVS